jgi:hypothetical protein
MLVTKYCNIRESVGALLRHYTNVLITSEQHCITLRKLSHTSTVHDYPSIILHTKQPYPRQSAYVYVYVYRNLYYLPSCGMHDRIHYYTKFMYMYMYVPQLDLLLFVLFGRAHDPFHYSVIAAKLAIS